jgi:protein-L-isoaspartate(D-aspartate) O-methyltransferase
MAEPADFTALRQEMVEQIALNASVVCDKTGRGVLMGRVMDTMAKVPRHEFVPAELRLMAYVDSPLPIGYGKTISQPFIVALMTDLLELKPGDHVLEIGTGLGYQAAILAELVHSVRSVEIIQELADDAKRRLRASGYGGVAIRVGDGNQGWAAHGPYDKIIVTAGPELIPAALLQQIKPEGKMVIPAGLESAQALLLVEKDSAGRIRTREILPVRFSPLVTSH